MYQGLTTETQKHRKIDIEFLWFCVSVVKPRLRIITICCASIVIAANAFAVTPAGFVYPIMGPRMSSDYGKRIHPVKHKIGHHEGIDLAAPQGSAIRAIAGGLVIYADPYAGYGNLIVVQHANGFTSHYGHCASFKVKTGQRISTGQIIGAVGSTGISTGPHLHFEIRYNGKTFDPERLLPGLADEAQG